MCGEESAQTPYWKVGIQRHQLVSLVSLSLTNLFSIADLTLRTQGFNTTMIILHVYHDWNDAIAIQTAITPAHKAWFWIGSPPHHSISANDVTSTSQIYVYKNSALASYQLGKKKNISPVSCFKGKNFIVGRSGKHFIFISFSLNSRTKYTLNTY
jgi:hypothetical protein